MLYKSRHVNAALVLKLAQSILFIRHRVLEKWYMFAYTLKAPAAVHQHI